MTSTKHSFCYDETIVDIGRVKHRRRELESCLLDAINEWLAKDPGNGYKNYMLHEAIDRLIMIQTDHSVKKAIRYFKWRHEGSITRDQFYLEEDQQLKEDRFQLLSDQMEKMQQQLEQMQILLVNISGGMNDELRQRREKVV